MKASRGYFAGIVPKNGTWCEVDLATFPKDSDSFVSLNEEDRGLLEAARAIGEYFAGI